MDSFVSKVVDYNDTKIDFVVEFHICNGLSWVPFFLENVL